MKPGLPASVALIATAAFIGVLGGLALGNSDGSLPEPGENYPATARPPLNFITLRSTPHTTGYYSGFYLYGERIEVECVVQGETIIRNELNSPDWYRLDDGFYTTALYIDLDNDWVVEPCADGAPESPVGIRDTAFGDAFFTPGGGPLLLHIDPDSDSEVLRELPPMARVTLLCHLYGQVETGVNQASELWYETDGGGWVFDGYLVTGSDNPIVEECPAR